MNRHQTRANTGRGFTLIELLVVIAIIILIISIILPALGGARRIARSTASKSLMTQLSTSIGSYRNDHAGEMPGPFTQAELGDEGNVAFGLTALENAMLDLASPNAIGQGIDQITLDPVGDGKNDIDIGLDLLGTGDGVYFDPSGDNMVAQEGETQVGAIDKRLPDLVDAFGNPILLWAEDEGAPSTPTSLSDVAAVKSAQRSRFYWNSNAAFLDAEFLGKNAGNQRALSLLSSTVGTQALAPGLAALTGDPGSPSPADFDVNSVLPGSSRGAFILHSPGPDNVYLSTEDRGSKRLPMGELAYKWNFFKADGTRLQTDADPPVDTSEDVIGGFDDLIVSSK